MSYSCIYIYIYMYVYEIYFRAPPYPLSFRIKGLISCVEPNAQWICTYIYIYGPPLVGLPFYYINILYLYIYSFWFKPSLDSVLFLIAERACSKGGARALAPCLLNLKRFRRETNFEWVRLQMMCSKGGKRTLALC